MSNTEIVVDGMGRVERFTVDGADLAEAVHSVGYQAIPGEQPVVTAYLKAGFSASTVGLVQAVEAESMRATVMGWLATLDGDLLEQAALESLGMGDSTGDGFLRALRAEAETIP